MANTPQAHKRIRRNASRTIVNRNRVSRIRTLIKKVELALTAGDKEGARLLSPLHSRKWRVALPRACCTRTPRRANIRA